MAALEQQLLQLQDSLEQQEVRNDEAMQRLKDENARLSEQLASVAEVAEKSRMENGRSAIFPCKVN